MKKASAAILGLAIFVVLMTAVMTTGEVNDSRPTSRPVSLAVKG